MNDVIKEKDSFDNNSIYYTDTDSLYIPKKFWSSLVDKGFVGELLALGKIDYAISGIFYAWFLAQKKKYCLLVDDFGVIAAKTTFKGHSGEHKLIKLKQLIIISEKIHFLVVFQLIGQNHLTESKYHTENKLV